MLSHPLRPLAHQSADRGRRDTEDGDSVVLDQSPEAIGVRVVGCSLEEHERRPDDEPAADQPGTHHPAEIGQPEEGVVVLQIEAGGQVMGGLDREPGVDVDRPLRATGGAGGVDEHVRLVGVGLDRREVWRRLRNDVVPPDVAARGPRDVITGAAQDEAGPHAGRLSHRLVGDGLHGNHLAAAEGAIGGDEQAGLTVVQPRAERLRSEPGEHRQEDGAQLAQSENRDHRFRQHRHEHPDAVSPAHAELAQRVRQPVRLGLQLAEGEPRAPRRRPPPRSARCARPQVLPHAGRGRW